MLAEEYAKTAFPVFANPTVDLSATLPSAFEPWLKEAGKPTASIYYFNTQTAGVLSAQKQEFCVAFISQRLHQDPESTCAIVVLPNRCEQLYKKRRESHAKFMS